MANITASCGFPFSWVENHHVVRNFLDDLLPLAAHISSYQLTNHIVPQELDQYRQLANRWMDRYQLPSFGCNYGNNSEAQGE